MDTLPLVDSSAATSLFRATAEIETPFLWEGRAQRGEGGRKLNGQMKMNSVIRQVQYAKRRQTTLTFV